MTSLQRKITTCHLINAGKQLLVLQCSTELCFFLTKQLLFSCKKVIIGSKITYLCGLPAPLKCSTLFKQYKTIITIVQPLTFTASVVIRTLMRWKYFFHLFFFSGGHSQVHGPRGLGVQNQSRKHRVLQAGRCLFHGSCTVGDHLQV